MAAPWLRPMANAVQTTLAPARAHCSLLVAGALVLFALTAGIAAARRFDWRGRVSYGVEALAMIAGLALVVTGFGGVGVPSQRLDAADGQRSGWQSWELGVLAAITVGAFAVRTWELGAALRVLIDEGNSIDHMAHVGRPVGVSLVEAPSV